MNFRDDYQCEFPQPNERELRAMDAVRAYGERCDAFDRTVCSGTYRGESVPTSPTQRALMIRNAIAVRLAVLDEFQIAESEFRDALRRTRR
jgi:hypothetical protein